MVSTAWHKAWVDRLCRQTKMFILCSQMQLCKGRFEWLCSSNAFNSGNEIVPLREPFSLSYCVISQKGGEQLSFIDCKQGLLLPSWLHKRWTKVVRGQMLCIFPFSLWLLVSIKYLKVWEILAQILILAPYVWFTKLEYSCYKMNI